MRYRWELSHRRGTPMPAWAPDIKSWKAWRPAEQPLVDKDPFGFEERLSLPISIAENSELLLEADETELFQEAAPLLRRDLAGFVQALDPWQDTFALFCLVRRELALEAFHPLAIAIATVYSAASGGGPVCGLRFPFHEIPLVSASAQLAVGLLVLGAELDLVAELCRSVSSSRHPDGGFGDADGPADVLTTFVSADLLLRIDPSFDFAPTQRALEAFRRSDGLLLALGPEALWLTSEVIDLLSLAERPFAERFRWPHVPRANRDRKTGLPFFSYFADLARLFGAIPGLAKESVELGFIDLVGFRSFNNEHGQDAGDDVLAELASALREISGVGSIRDGGDEFLLVAPPGQEGLAGLLETFRYAWVERFHRRFGADTGAVLPRIIVCTTSGRELSQAREDLGRRITALKEEAPDAAGILRVVGA